MKATRVLFTDLKKGNNEIAENCSYLKKKFFDEHPTEKPDKPKEDELNRTVSQ